MLLSLWPIFLFLYISVKAFLGSPVIFSQNRPGLHCKSFTLYKFRSMSNATDVHGVALPDYLRTNKFGQLLRSTSLDELPSLLNVLLGQLSFVGPRPLLTEYLPLYNEEQIQRHNVLPGISGLAQVSGRNLLSWDQKLQLDIYYINNMSFLLDTRILFKTILKVFLRQGINSPENAPSDHFTGSSASHD